MCGPSIPYEFGARTVFGDSVAIYGWPSRGGVIVLEAEAIDFEWLGMSPLDPQMNREDEEDDFCQRLLLLGAFWWDSLERYFYVGCYRASIENNCEIAGHGDGSFRHQSRPEPTVSESTWIKVGWPSEGGLWVAEFQQTWGIFDDERTLPPDDVDFGREKLARSMDERCEVLRRHFHATFYQDVADYKGIGCLKAWKDKYDGEVGRLLTPEETLQEWRDSR